MNRLTFPIQVFKNISKLGYSVTFLSQALVLVSGLVNSVLLARGLGVTGRGELAAIMLWPTLLVYLGGFGLTEATLYFASQKNYSINAVHTCSLLFSLILGLLFIIIGYYGLPIVLGSSRPVIIDLSRVFLILVLTGMLLGHYANILRAKLRLNTYNIIFLVIPVGSTIGAFLLITFGLLMSETIIFVHLFLSILGIVYAIFILIKDEIITQIEFDIVIFNDMLKYGIRVYIGTIWSAANLRLDQVLLAPLISPTQFGLYIVAVRVSSISSFLASVITTVAIPRIAQYQVIQERITALTKVFRIFWWLSIGIKVIYLIALPFVLTTFYGEDFSDAFLPSTILIFASLFLDTKSLLTGGVQILNSPWLGSKAEIISSLFTIVLLLFFIPSLGILGAAVASVGAYCVGMIVLLRGIKTKHNLKLQDMFLFRRSQS